MSATSPGLPYLPQQPAHEPPGAAQPPDGFGGQLLEWLNGGMLTLMVSIGHRTGLWDTMARLPPATSPEIARRARLNERYVREWLAALVVGGIVKYDAVSETYRLPDEHASWLTRESASPNLAVPAQWLAILGGVEDQVVHCFREGGGIPESHYPRCQETMAEQSAQSVVTELTTAILPLVTGLAEKLTEGIRVLDVGCGLGKMLLALAGNYPRSTFIGCDISRGAIARARHAARQHGYSHLHFTVQDAAQIREEQAFDLITVFQALHEQTQPVRMLRCLARALRPGGVLLVQDIWASSFVEQNANHPLGPFLYAHSCMLGMAVSLARGGVGLGTVWGVEHALEVLREAGFREVRVARVPHDFQHVYLIAQPGSG